MKSILVGVLTFLIILGSYQSLEAQRVYSSGDRTFEIMMNPFSDTPVSFNEFRYRKFRNFNFAFRLRGSIQYSSFRYDEGNKDTEFNGAFAPGVELHAFQNRRLSVYYGAEVILSILSTREQRTNPSTNVSYTNKNTGENENFGLGLNAIAGVDIHFLDWLYAGVEVGYGITRRDYFDAEVNDELIKNYRVDYVLGQFTSSLFRFGVEF